jgi:hypothetical protein
MSIQQQDRILQQKYDLLKNERFEEEKIKKDFQTLNSANEDKTFIVTSNYYTYIVLLFVTILLVFLLLKYSFTEQQFGGGKNFKNEAFFLFSIMISFLSLSKVFNNYEIYIFISILVIAYTVIRIKMNQ